MIRYESIMLSLMQKPFTVDGTLDVGHPWHLGNNLLIRAVETSAPYVHGRKAGQQARELAKKQAYA